MLPNKTIGLFLLLLSLVLFVVGIVIVVDFLNVDTVLGWASILVGIFALIVAFSFIGIMKGEVVTEVAKPVKVPKEKKEKEKKEEKKEVESEAVGEEEPVASKPVKEKKEKKEKKVKEPEESTKPEHVKVGSKRTHAKKRAVPDDLGDSDLAKAIRRGSEVIESKVDSGKMTDEEADANFAKVIAYKPKIGTPEESAAVIEVSQIIGYLIKA